MRRDEPSEVSDESETTGEVSTAASEKSIKRVNVSIKEKQYARETQLSGDPNDVSVLVSQEA